MCGLILEGIFAGGTPNTTKYTKDGKEHTYVYLLVDGGSNSWRVQSDYDYMDKVHFGDIVKFTVRARAWNNNVYFYGELLNEN